MVTCLSFGPMRGPDSMENFIERLPPFDFVYDKIQGATTGNTVFKTSEDNELFILFCRNV